MATVSETLVNDGLNGQPRVIKFVGFNMKAADVTAAFDTTGYHHMVVYGISNTITAPAGTGAITLHADVPDTADTVAVNASNAAATGAYGGSRVLVETSSTGAISGGGASLLPKQSVLVGDAGNSVSTTYTIDLYVELHRQSN